MNGLGLSKNLIKNGISTLEKYKIDIFQIKDHFWYLKKLHFLRLSNFKIRSQCYKTVVSNQECVRRYVRNIKGYIRFTEKRLFCYAYFFIFLFWGYMSKKLLWTAALKFKNLIALFSGHICISPTPFFASTNLHTSGTISYVRFCNSCIIRRVS